MNEAFRPVGLVLVAALSVVGHYAWQKASDKELVKWQTDLQLPSDNGSGTPKPVFVYFTAGRCGWCQKMKQTTWNDPAVAKALDRFVAVKIDVDAHPDLAKRYRITGLPAFVVLDSTGQRIAGSEGYMDAPRMLDWIGAR